MKIKSFCTPKETISQVGFSPVAAGTCGIFSSYDGDAHSKREFVSEVRTFV